MAAPTKKCLLSLPNEILLLIFHQIPTIQDVCSLAQSCLGLYKLFTSGRNKLSILRSVARIPAKRVYDLDKIFSVLTRIPPLNWQIQSAEKSGHILIDVDYEHIVPAMAETTMLSLPMIQALPQYSDTSYLCTLEIFLTQFQALRTLSPNHYERTTERILSDAAQLQKDLLRESSTSVTDLSSETTLIALSLHCLLVVQDIDHIIMHTGGFTEGQIFADGSPAVLVEPDDDGYTNLPLIQAHYLKDPIVPPTSGARAPGFYLDSAFDTTLEYIFDLAYKLLDTEDPRHWPTVLHVLMILDHIHGSVWPHQSWMNKVLEAAGSYQLVIQELERYYYICTHGGEILSDRWNEDDYGRRVGQNQIAIEHARALNRLWLDADDGEWDTRDGKTGVDGFPDKVNYFAYGCAI